MRARSTTRASLPTVRPALTTNLADPIGVLFYGDVRHAHANGHSHRVFGLIDFMPVPEEHGEWNNTDADPQFVGSSNGGTPTCTTTEYQAATSYFDYPDGHEEGARYHVRLNQNGDPGPGGDWRTVGTPHYDVHINEDDCEDSVPPDQPGTPNRDSGFDLARGHLKNDWVAAYGPVGDVQSWRNTRLIHQCNPNDHWDSGSNGRVYYLDSDQATTLAPALEPPDEPLGSGRATARPGLDYSLKPCGEEFPRYYGGDSLNGLALHSRNRRCSDPDPTPSTAAGGAIDPDSLGRANFESYIYGSCEILAGQGCAPPLEIQTWPACERSPADYNAGAPGDAHPIEPIETARLRGVPARFYAGGSLELSAGAVTIVIYAHTRENLVAAATELRTEPGSPTVVRQGDALPTPAGGAQEGTLSC